MNIYPISRLFEKIQEGPIKGCLAAVKLKDKSVVNTFFGYSVEDRVISHFRILFKKVLSRGNVEDLYKLGNTYIVIFREQIVKVLKVFEDLRMEITKNPLIVRGIGEYLYPVFVSVVCPYREIRTEVELDDLLWAVERAIRYFKKDSSIIQIVPLSDEVLRSIISKRNQYRLFLNAIKKDNLIVAFQKIVDISNKKTFAQEALARIRMDGKVISAGPFIQALSSLEAEIDLDGIILDKVLRLKKEKKIRDKVSINVSGRFLDQKFDLLKNYIDSLQIDPDEIIVELTEREDVEKITGIDDKIKELKCDGFSIFIDDFGAGYSNFHLLDRYEFDGVKIDGSFIKHMKENSLKRKFVEFVVATSTQQDKAVVAEFVETAELEEEMKRVKKKYDVPDGKLFVQGYYYGRPEIVC